jgi:hypothetical protein
MAKHETCEQGFHESDDIIDRVAKDLIARGYSIVSPDLAVFAHIFGERELEILRDYSFDYAYTKRKIKPEKITDFDREVYIIMNVTAHGILKAYNQMTPEKREEIELVYPDERELEIKVRNEDIYVVQS